MKFTSCIKHRFIYSPVKTSKKNCFAKIVNGSMLLAILAKHFIWCSTWFWIRLCKKFDLVICKYFFLVWALSPPITVGWSYVIRSCCQCCWFKPRFYKVHRYLNTCGFWTKHLNDLICLRPMCTDIYPITTSCIKCNFWWGYFGKGLLAKVIISY